MTSPRFLKSKLIFPSLFEDDSETLFWPKAPISVSNEPLEPYKLHISLPMETGSQRVDVSISLWFPVGEQASRKYFSIHGGNQCRIAWNILRPVDPERSPWRSTVYFSTLPYGWIPDDGIHFFNLFIVYLKGRWVDLCQQAEEHLSTRVSYISLY